MWCDDIKHLFPEMEMGFPGMEKLIQKQPFLGLIKVVRIITWLLLYEKNTSNFNCPSSMVVSHL